MAAAGRRGLTACGEAKLCGERGRFPAEITGSDARGIGGRVSKIDAGSALNLDLVKMFVVLKVGNSSLL